MSLHINRSSWARVKFGDVVANVNDSVKDPTASGIERLLGLEHLDPGELAITRWGTVSDETTFTRRVRPGQTLFGKRRAYQRKTAYAELDAICSGDILVFTPKDSAVLLPELLPFIVSTDSFYAKALETSAGSLSPRTRWSDLAKYEFDLPPLREQRRIAALLWSAQRHRSRLAHLAYALEQAKLARIDEAFIHPPAATPMLRLDSVTRKIVDGVHKRPQYTAEGIPFLTVENLTAGPGIDFQRTRFVSADAHAEFIKRTHPERGDVLVTKDGTLGVARVVETDQDFSIFVSVALLKPTPDIDPWFLKSYFDSTTFRSSLASKTSGSALKHIHLVDFRSAIIPVPDLEWQRRLVSDVQSIDAALQRLAEESDAIGRWTSLFLRASDHEGSP